MIRFKSSVFVERVMRRIRVIAAALLCALPLEGVAAGFGNDLQIHGFVTQGYVNTSDNNFFGDSEDGSFDFTEIGVNASYKVTPSILVSGQVLSRRAGEMDDGSPSIDFALVDWNVFSDEHLAWGFKIGRVKNPLGLYNDTRDVAFTRPSIFLPEQIYFDRVRDLLHSSDSVHVYARRYSDFGTWDFDFGVGVGTVDKNVEIAFLSRDFGGELDTDGLAYVGRIGFETADGVWRFALSGAHVGLAFDGVATDPLGDGDIDVGFLAASAQYNAERWSLTAEYIEEPVEFSDFGTPLDVNDATAQGYYLQGSYLLRNDLELLVRYAEGFAEKDDRSGAERSALTGGRAPRHSFFGKDWMLGVRWDVTPSFMLRAEYQWNTGTRNLSLRENPNPMAAEKDWEMFSLLGSYRF